jgi:hypothetical protein
VDIFPDLSIMSDVELDGLLREFEDAEDEISLRRRSLHDRIDRLRHERVERLKQRVASGSIDLPAPESLERPIFDGTGDAPSNDDLGGEDDLSTIDDTHLRGRIGELERLEDDVSLERRVIHGRIDIVRAERARRMRGGEWDPQDLSRRGAGGE